nr:MAG TPA: hypothetical protein [Caudoviricetes sp.]
MLWEKAIVARCRQYGAGQKRLKESLFDFTGRPTTYPAQHRMKESQGGKSLTRASYVMPPTVIMKGVVL